MYTGKNRTALASQRQIADTMTALMREIPYADISVAELCRRANVSRQTFYSLFRSKENVVSYLLHEALGPKPSHEPRPGESSLRYMCRLFSLYVSDHREILGLLMKNGQTRLILDKLYRAFQQDGPFVITLPEKNRDYYALFLAGGLARLEEEFLRADLDQQTMEEITFQLLNVGEEDPPGA